MSEGGIEVAGGQMKDFDIDQLAASVALMLRRRNDHRTRNLDHT